ncbi:MAG: MFS transporter [Oscillospiraceae bacterium]|nr:MFS transporter [Oscillospiraceae bacterium]
MRPDYNATVRACFAGYIVQAVVNNFVPLLFLIFQSQLGLDLGQITSLITINFTTQLLVDLLAARCIDKIGYRAGIVAAHVFAAAGFVMLAVLPFVMPAYIGILLSVICYAIGGGLLEVLVSPIVEACPTAHKEKTMSLLHSFYCWGQVGVVLISTLFLMCCAQWRILALIWALLPAVNAVVFLRVPIAPPVEEGASMTIRQLFRKPVFWLLMFLMFCAGACELAVSQWASAFAEQGLNVSKTIGDITGPMFFAVLMGLARLLYGKWGDRIDLRKFIAASGILCAGAYLLTALSPWPVLSLLGCGICGFSVGIFWPGTFSMAASALKKGGTAMFAFLALAGDLGCAGGPTFVGIITDLCGERLHCGILAGVLFPLLLLGGMALYRHMHQKGMEREAIT